ncbi:uncharacterized protein LOC141630776 [Silene latifolia]|uniref:uncharacterized protein LOC141630776 n=1 Tax=Silene latifolia TaxID=37657 RepID=UPI003D77570F
MFVENLIGKKDTCSSFYLDFIVDENKCLAGVFWADPICIKNYMLFGEVLSADATYRTNKYDMVFVPFTGVDHHKRCITFGAGLLGDENFVDCRFKDVEKIDETKIYILSDLQMPNKSWNVAYSPDNMEITCSCSMFQRMGLLCSTAFGFYTTKIFVKIPKQDITQRWTKAAMSKPVFDKDGKLIDVSQKFSDRKSLSTELWQEVYSCVSVAECDDNDMKLLIEKREILDWI